MTLELSIDKSSDGRKTKVETKHDENGEAHETRLRKEDSKGGDDTKRYWVDDAAACSPRPAAE